MSDELWRDIFAEAARTLRANAIVTICSVKDRAGKPQWLVNVKGVGEMDAHVTALGFSVTTALQQALVLLRERTSKKAAELREELEALSR